MEQTQLVARLTDENQALLAQLGQKQAASTADTSGEQSDLDGMLLACWLVGLPLSCCQRQRDRYWEEHAHALVMGLLAVVGASSKREGKLQETVEQLEKRLQRLNEVFGKTVKDFRAACYELTGYTIESSTVDGGFRYVWAVRSKADVVRRFSGRAC